LPKTKQEETLDFALFPFETMSRRKTREPKEETVTLGPAVRDGEQVFGVVHISASFNDTLIHVTDLSGRETLVRITGGMKLTADRDGSAPYAAMLAAHDVAQRCKELGITAMHVKLHATCVRALARSGMKIGRIGCDPNPNGQYSTKEWKKGKEALSSFYGVISIFSSLHLFLFHFVFTY
ncbi:hypothetical protein IGI04_018780, partial [Brassica rapa subsp. trilocularis]